MNKLLQYIQDQATRYTATQFRPTGVGPSLLRFYTDSAWAQDPKSKKSISGAVMLSEGLKIHAHSRGEATVASSSCEEEWYATREGLKGAMLTKVLIPVI